MAQHSTGNGNGNGRVAARLGLEREIGVPGERGARMALAEVDGNRTRRTGIARPDRFEDGGAHQVPGHLRGTP